MSAIAVRLASAADAAFVGALARTRPYTAKWSDAALVAEVARPDSVFVVAGAPVKAYALARLAAGEAQLLDLASESDGRGLGRAVFSGLLSAAKARGAKRLSFEVSEKNARALSFYAAAGAEVVGRRKKFYDDGSDAFLMDLNIP